ncbi:hypothetical protein RFI_14852, partial [Reticulomyxa filosa]
MNKLEINNMKENEEKYNSEVKGVGFGRSCYNKDWILRTNKYENINDLICVICKGVANKAMEINCPEHGSLDESLIAGENCLKEFFKKNGNNCPIGMHNGCLYSQGILPQRYINELNVMCPLQFEQDLIMYNEDGEEGEIPGMLICDFKGRLEQIRSHLENDCPLQLLGCWFKPFGCTYQSLKYQIQDHLISNMQFHFDLIMQRFEMLNKTIQMNQ